MKKYLLNNVNEALLRVEDGYEKILTNIVTPDMELFFMIYADLIPLAALVRIQLSSLKNKPNVRCYKKVKESNNYEQYYYSDEFREIGCSINKSLQKVCDYLIHRQDGRIIDNRLSSGRKQKDLKLILFLRTDEICEECKRNNGYSKKEKYRDHRRSHVYTEDCNCGFYVDLGDFINKIKKLIK